MGKIYVGQYFKITLTAETDITNWTNVKIKSKKPEGTIVEYSTTTLDIATGKVQAKIQASDNTKAGEWINWIIGSTADSKPMIGEPHKFNVFIEGN